jgi:plastocyanin
MLVAAAVGTAAVAGSAVALAATAGDTATLTAKSGTAFAINKFAKDTSHFTPGTVDIKSGGTLTVRNVGGAPHTLSIVTAAQRPKTTKQIEQCKICSKLGKEHGADPSSNAPPKKPVLDVGAPGIDQAGDSVFFVKTTTLKISAPAGTTLHFICLIHPWMQGKIVVQ